MLALVFAHLLQVDAAAPAGLGLQWNAPAECPEASAVAAMVARLVRAGEGERAPTTVRGTITRVPAGYELELGIESPRGRHARRVRSADCQALARTTALVAAIDLDPLAVTRALGPALPDAADPPVAAPADEAGLVPLAPALAPESDELSEATSRGSAAAAPGGEAVAEEHVLENMAAGTSTGEVRSCPKRHL